MGGERDRAPGQRKIARRPGVGHVPPMKIFLLALSVMCCLHGLSLADEIEDAVSNAMKLYKEGKAGEAAAGLDGAELRLAPLDLDRLGVLAVDVALQYRVPARG